MKNFKVDKWKRIRKQNPYRFEEPTSEDPRFWTNTQLKAWNDFYLTHDPLVCDQEPIDMAYYERNMTGELRHIHLTLVKMDIAPLLQI